MFEKTVEQGMLDAFPEGNIYKLNGEQWVKLHAEKLKDTLGLLVPRTP
jgi:hypothetical protein